MLHDPTFSLRQLRYYVAAAEAGSISVASKHLYISQSSISKAVQELEQELGFKLLNRTAHGMSMTTEGQQFLKHAKKIIAEVANSRDIFTSRRRALKGELRIGVTPMVAAYVFPRILHRFHHAYPEIETLAREDTREHLEHSLIDGEIDVALMLLTGNVASAFGTDIIDVSVYKAWVPMGQSIGRDGMVTLAELGRQRQIVLDNDEIDDVITAAWEARQMKPRVLLRTRSVGALRNLVASGQGIAVLPEIAFRQWSLDGAMIEAIDIEEGLEPIMAAAVWRRGSSLKDTAQAFLETIHRPN